SDNQGTGQTGGAIGLSLNFLVTFSFKRKSDKQSRKKSGSQVQVAPLFKSTNKRTNSRNRTTENTQIKKDLWTPSSDNQGTGQTGGAIRLSLNFLVTFLSREKVTNNPERNLEVKCKPEP
ncbi:MAG: hypothetical protein ABIY62_05495, partial [Ginsengibacter sp.]